MIDLFRVSRFDDSYRQFDELLNRYKSARAELLAKVDAGTSYEMEGTQIVYKNPKTGEKVVVKGYTNYDVLEAKYGVERAEIHRASFKLESSDGKELDPKDKAKGYKIFCENPLTGERVLVKGFTDYDVLEIKYKAECDDNNRLQQRVAKQKRENEVLHRKVNDLVHKLRQARRERDELAEKLRIAEEDDKKRSLLIETLNQLLNEES